MFKTLLPRLVSRSRPFSTAAAKPYSVPAGLAAGGAAAAAFLLVLSNKENFILNEAAAAAATSFVVEQTTKTHVPLQHESLSLVGSGVRQVTFLNVSVYVAALYIDSDLKSQIKGSQLWSNFTANTMAANTVEGRWFAKDLVERMKGEMTLTILPVRNTNGSHMKAGFVKSFNAFLEKEKPVLSADQAKTIKQDIETFSKEFPSSAFTTKTLLVFTKTRENELKLEIDGQQVLSVPSKWIAQRFFESYLDAAAAPSPKIRKSIGEGLEKLVSSSSQ